MSHSFGASFIEMKNIETVMILQNVLGNNIYDLAVSNDEF